MFLTNGKVLHINVGEYVVVMVMVMMMILFPFMLPLSVTTIVNW